MERAQRSGASYHPNRRRDYLPHNRDGKWWLSCFSIVYKALLVVHVKNVTPDCSWSQLFRLLNAGLISKIINDQRWHRRVIVHTISVRAKRWCYSNSFSVIVVLEDFSLKVCYITVWVSSNMVSLTYNPLMIQSEENCGCWWLQSRCIWGFQLPKSNKISCRRCFDKFFTFPFN